jgi:hypothetical protein
MPNVLSEIFRDGCPGGKTPEEVGARTDRVIARARAIKGNVALFAHGYLLACRGLHSTQLLDPERFVATGASEPDNLGWKSSMQRGPVDGEQPTS